MSVARWPISRLEGYIEPKTPHPILFGSLFVPFVFYVRLFSRFHAQTTIFTNHYEPLYLCDTKGTEEITVDCTGYAIRLFNS